MIRSKHVTVESSPIAPSVVKLLTPPSHVDEERLLIPQRQVRHGRDNVLTSLHLVTMNHGTAFLRLGAAENRGHGDRSAQLYFFSKPSCNFEKEVY
jgi:hypothetical protein